MLHGNKDTFAIEWELAANPEGRLMEGTVCIWAGGNMVGDNCLLTTLSDVLACLTYPVGDCGKRSSSRFCRMDGSEAFATLNAGLFDGDESNSAMMEDETWARFDISIPVDVFDGWRLYLIDCNSHSRMLLGHRTESERAFRFVSEVQLAVGEFDKVIAEFEFHLEEQQRRF